MLLIMQFSPVLYYFIFPRAKYLSRHLSQNALNVYSSHKCIVLDLNFFRHNDMGRWQFANLIGNKLFPEFNLLLLSSLMKIRFVVILL